MALRKASGAMRSASRPANNSLFAKHRSDAFSIATSKQLALREASGAMRSASRPETPSDALSIATSYPERCAEHRDQHTGAMR